MQCTTRLSSSSLIHNKVQCFIHLATFSLFSITYSTCPSMNTSLVLCSGSSGLARLVSGIALVIVTVYHCYYRQKKNATYVHMKNGPFRQRKWLWMQFGINFCRHHNLCTAYTEIFVQSSRHPIPNLTTMHNVFNIRKFKISPASFCHC